MERRGISKALLMTATGALLLGERAQAQTCTAPCYPIDPHETAALVTPTNTAFPPLDIRRYGAVGNNSTDCSGAIAQAISVAATATAILDLGAVVYIPKGVYRLASTVSLRPGICLRGDGYYASNLMIPDSVVGFKYEPATYTEAAITFEHLSVRGSGNAAGDLLQFGNGTFAHLYNVRLRNTAGSCINVTNAGTPPNNGFLELSLNHCILENFGRYGIEGNALCSLLSVRNSKVNVDDINGIALLGILSAGAGQVTLEQVNVNGNGTLDNVIRVVNGNLGQCAMRECYAEQMLGPIIKSAGTGVIAQLSAEGGNWSTLDSADVDLSGTAVHKQIILRNVSSTRTTGSFFVPGPTTSYEVSNIVTSGAAIVNGVNNSGNEETLLRAAHFVRSDWQMAPLILGSYYLWIDSAGRLRIKNGSPTSTNDGAVVGSQV
jgi:hypothetical protein